MTPRRVRARLLSILRGRQQPASSADDPELERVARGATPPHRKAEHRPVGNAERR